MLFNRRLINVTMQNTSNSGGKNGQYSIKQNDLLTTCFFPAVSMTLAVTTSNLSLDLTLGSPSGMSNNLAGSLQDAAEVAIRTFRPNVLLTSSTALFSSGAFVNPRLTGSGDAVGINCSCYLVLLEEF